MRRKSRVSFFLHLYHPWYILFSVKVMRTPAAILTSFHKFITRIFWQLFDSFSPHRFAPGPLYMTWAHMHTYFKAECTRLDPRCWALCGNQIKSTLSPGTWLSRDTHIYLFFYSKLPDSALLMSAYNSRTSFLRRIKEEDRRQSRFSFWKFQHPNLCFIRVCTLCTASFIMCSLGLTLSKIYGERWIIF